MMVYQAGMYVEYFKNSFVDFSENISQIMKILATYLLNTF